MNISKQLVAMGICRDTTAIYGDEEEAEWLAFYLS
jgi:hypothetical protein